MNKRTKLARQWAAILILFSAILGTGIHMPAEESAAARIQTALGNHDFASALQIARTSLKRNPNQPTILAMEGFVLANLGREQEALAVYRAALRMNPNSLPALEGAAQIEYRTGDPDAEILLRRIASLRPNDPKSHAILALIAFQKGDCATASDQFKRAEQSIARQPLALAEYASCLVDENRAADAVDLLHRAIAIDPADSYLLYNLSVAQQAAGMSKQAIETIEPLLKTAHPDPDALDLAAVAHEALNETPEAVSLLRMAIIEDPRQLQYYMDLASIAFRHGSWDVGMEVVNHGLNELPRATALYVARGILYIQVSNYKAARTDFETATRLDPSQTGAAISEAMADIQQRDPAMALDTIQAQLRAHPNETFLLYLKALALSKKGAAPGSVDFVQAMAAAREAASNEHGLPAARDLLAEMDLQANQPLEAEGQSRKALEEDASDAKALYQLIRALGAQGKDHREELAALKRRLSDLLQQERASQTMPQSRYRLSKPDAALNRPK